MGDKDWWHWVVKRGDGRMKGRRLMGSLKLNIGILLNFTLEAKIVGGIGRGEEGRWLHEGTDEVNGVTKT